MSLNFKTTRMLFLSHLSIDWRIKTLLQLSFSFIPKDEPLNYLIQQYVIRSLPVSDTDFVANVSYAKKHIDALQQHSHLSRNRSAFYEFGTSWDIIIPLTFYTYGVENEILIDIRNLIRVPLINITIEKYQK